MSRSLRFVGVLVAVSCADGRGEAADGEAANGDAEGVDTDAQRGTPVAFDECGDALGDAVVAREVVWFTTDTWTGDLHEGVPTIFDTAAATAEALAEYGFAWDGSGIDFGPEQAVVMVWSESICAQAWAHEIVAVRSATEDASLNIEVTVAEPCDADECGTMPRVVLWATPSAEVAACERGTRCE